MKHKYGRIIVGGSIVLVIGIVFYGFAGYAYLNRQRVVDQLRVWKFTPTAAISEQVHRTGMSGDGKFLYLASEPTIESKTNFNTVCSVVTADTSILGCYISRTQRSYIYRETDSRLDGTEELWAAHEMLRAAWDRMSPTQRASLRGPLATVLMASTDESINLSGRIADVNRDDPTDREAELYAIVGTEVPIVGTTLERNYSQYFVSRDAVTKLAAHARSYVVALKLKVDALSTTISDLGRTIDKRVKTFNSSAHKLDSAISSFNSRARTPGGFATLAQFNAERAILISRQHALRATMSSINHQVDAFNANLKKLRGLSETAASLIKSLNVELAPLPDLSNA